MTSKSISVPQVAIAANPKILKQRLHRFFYLHNNHGRRQVTRISEQLTALGSVYLFGGAIRDIALHGIRHFYADLDFVVDCSAAKLDKLIHQISAKDKIIRNKFGGYRILCDKWWLDVWALESTWAFKHNIIPFNNELSLLNTTILNWDAILFNINNKM